MTRSFLLATALAAPSMASAFCGTFVGSADAELFNESSQVAMARQGNHTVLTFATNYEGDLDKFAMVVPVPAVLDEYDVTTVSAELFHTIDAYSGPRVVKYTCDDFRWHEGGEYYGGGGGGCGAGDDDIVSYDSAAESDDGSGGEATSVVVENEFSVGIYDIVILSAEESGDLVVWLSANGFDTSPEAADMLQDYIDEGQVFFAAKVDLGNGGPAGEGPLWLEPLQIRYESEAWSLPVRLGTLNSPGDQDVVVYTVTNIDDGDVSISNYPELTLDDECMAKGVQPDDFGEFFKSTFETQVASLGGAGFLREFSWAPYHCDPCVTEPLDQPVLTSLGFSGSPESARFTRLHVRYSTDEARDIQLYATGLMENSQVRYILYDQKLEWQLPVCGEGMVDDPGECDWMADDDSGDQAAVPWPLIALGWLGGLVALARRRRS